MDAQAEKLNSRESNLDTREGELNARGSYLDAQAEKLNSRETRSMPPILMIAPEESQPETFEGNLSIVQATLQKERETSSPAK